MKNSLDHWLQVIEDEHIRANTREFSGVLHLSNELGLTRPAQTNVIIGGTNGKGSTVNYLEQILLRAGHSVGSTVSPHLTRYNERFRINGALVDDELIATALSHIHENRDGVVLTYFDYTMLAALYLMTQVTLRYALVEVGLGGALDCANVVNADAACITNISLDHMNRLGDTRELIAIEKAGILRRNVPFVFGEREMPATLRARSSEFNCPTYQWNEQFGFSDDHDELYVTQGETRVRFKMDNRNPDLAMAAQLAELLESSVNARDVQHASVCSLPGRIESMTYAGKTWILDIAHNPGAVEFLRGAITSEYPARNLICIFACVSDKQVTNLLASLKAFVKYTVVTDSLGIRGLSAASIMQKIDDHSKLAFVPSLGDAVQTALKSTLNDDLILVCGSVDVVSRARCWLLSTGYSE